MGEQYGHLDNIIAGGGGLMPQPTNPSNPQPIESSRKVVYNGTTVKKIIYNGAQIKKGYCNGVNVFTSDHIVTYRIKGQTWTATIEDGENGATTTAANTARGKMGSGDTFLGWTKTNGSTSYSNNISITDDGIILYGVWKHTHVGSSTVKGGCYNGSGSTVDTVTRTGGSDIWYDGCGCSHQRHDWRCSSCGSTWSSQTNHSGGCTEGHSQSDDGDSNCPRGCNTKTTYALSCGKTAGTFCG